MVSFCNFPRHAHIYIRGELLGLAIFTSIQVLYKLITLSIIKLSRLQMNFFQYFLLVVIISRWPLDERRSRPFLGYELILGIFGHRKLLYLEHWKSWYYGLCDKYYPYGCIRRYSNNRKYWLLCLIFFTPVIRNLLSL